VACFVLDNEASAQNRLSQPVRQVIKQLAAAFNTEEPAATLAIRDADDVLVTDENLTIKVMEGDDLK
jgi:hypothetical protein